MSLLSVDQVADLLGMSTKYVRTHTHSGEIPHIRLGDRIRYRPEDIEKFISSRVRGGESE